MFVRLTCMTGWLIRQRKVELYADVYDLTRVGTRAMEIVVGSWIN